MQKAPPLCRARGEQVQQVERGQHQKSLQRLDIKTEAHQGRPQAQQAQAPPPGGGEESSRRQEYGQDHEHIRGVVAARGDDYRSDGQGQRGQEPRYRPNGTANQMV